MRFESAAPSRGTKRAKPESRTYRLQSLSRVRTLCRASPQIGIGKLWGLKFQIVSDFRSTFFFPKNRLNFGSPQIAWKFQKSDPGAFLAPILVVFGTRFWHQFSLYFTIPRKPLFCNTSPAKRSFSPPKPCHFGTNFRSNFDVFRISFSDTIFSSFFQHDTQKHDFWTPLGIQLGPKWRQKSQNSAKVGF